jgi:Spy/CpxP family protein refolding chaperone
MGMHRGHMRGGQQFMLARLVSNPALRARLGISPEQAQKIRAEVFDFRKAEITNRADAKVKHLELADLLSADTPDRSAIDKKLEELSTVRLAGQKAAVNFRLDMRNALTAEQREKLEQMRHDFFHQGGFDHHGPHGPKGNMPPAGPAGEL